MSLLDLIRGTRLGVPLTRACYRSNSVPHPRNSPTNSPAGNARTRPASRYRSVPACTTSSRSRPSVSTAERIDRVSRGASDRLTSNP